MSQKVLRTIPIIIEDLLIRKIIIREGKFDPYLLEIELPKEVNGICQIPRDILQGL
jgi:hypothetical protein